MKEKADEPYKNKHSVKMKVFLLSQMDYGKYYVQSEVYSQNYFTEFATWYHNSLKYFSNPKKRAMVCC